MRENGALSPSRGDILDRLRVPDTGPSPVIGDILDCCTTSKALVLHQSTHLKCRPCRGSLRHFRTSPTVCSTNACLYSTLPTPRKRGRFRIHKSPTETRTFPVPQQAWMRFSKKSPLQHPGTYKKTVAHSRNTGFRACEKTGILSSVGTVV